MKLQDYIHYYIGCEVIVDGKDRKLLTGGIFVPNEVNQIYYNIEEDDGFSMPYNEDADDPEPRVKPILRKLEDVRDEEWLEIESKIPENNNRRYLKVAFTTSDIYNWCHWIVLSKALIELRELGVDVDGLIDSGLAIDSKTLK